MTSTPPVFRVRRPAFTLVELMVSIALVLILIYGVNRVFKITADTVGTTNMMGEKVRDMRAAKQTFTNDFNNAVLADAPFFIIQSGQTYAFRNRADLDADKDGQPSTYDPTSSGTETSIRATDVSFRSHRVDQVRFFTGGLLRRQTADDDYFYASQITSSEAVVTYGHLNLFDGTRAGAVGTLSGPDFRGPGPTLGGNLQTNPHNYFAADWILGRSQLLLLPSAANAGQDYIMRTPVPPPTTNELSGTDPPSFSISPIAIGSRDQNNVFLVQSSRFDLGQGSMYDLWSSVSRYTDYNAIRQSPTPANEEPWWNRMTYRFWGNAYPTKPIDNLQAALTAPIFLRGCTQFIVEFAGDFGNQGGGPGLPAPGQDGVIDYVADNNGTRRIRWYGFPRDVASDTANVTFKGGPDDAINKDWDVVPMRDVLYPSATPPLNWPEKVYPVANPPANYVGSLNANAQYVVAFGPRELERGIRFEPKLIRITLVLDDPGDKLTQGQTYEYIFKLGL